MECPLGEDFGPWPGAVRGCWVWAMAPLRLVAQLPKPAFVSFPIRSKRTSTRISNPKFLGFRRCGWCSAPDDCADHGFRTWSIGVLGYWSVGVLEYWSIGVLEYCRLGVLEVPPGLKVLKQMK